MTKIQLPVTVDLLAVEEDYLGLIVPASTLVTYTNQVGGSYCGCPAIEGIFVPVSSIAPDPDDDPLRDYYMTEKSEPFDKAKRLIEVFLHRNEFLRTWFTMLESWEEVPGTPGCVAEAWVPVRVRSVASGNPWHYNGSSLEPFVGHVGILTYPNSD